MAVCSTMALPAEGRAAGIDPVRRCDQECRAVQEHVEIAVRSGRHARHALERAKGGGDFLRDGAWRLAKPLRQLERDRRAEVAKVAVGRVIDGESRERRRLEREDRGQQLREVLPQPIVDR